MVASKCMNGPRIATSPWRQQAPFRRFSDEESIDDNREVAGEIVARKPPRTS